MFTGIIEAQASIKKIFKKGRSATLVLQVPAAYSRSKIGSSLAVDGVCLTVSARAKDSGLSFDLVPETLRRSHFRYRGVGDRLNLERPLRWKGRLDGHVVQGHVDGAGRVRKVLVGKKDKSLQIVFPSSLKPYILPKGSITINGVSLTIGKVQKNLFWVHVIPTTLRKTNLAILKPGESVNLEADALLKFFHRLTSKRANYKLMHP